MKNRQLIAFIALFLLFISSSFAMVNTYDNKKDFEEKEGDICRMATDGCNNFGVENGKIRLNSKKWVAEKFKFSHIREIKLV